MNIEHGIYQILIEVYGEKLQVTDSLYQGIMAYVEQNGLRKALSGCSERDGAALLKIYMRPLLDMPKGELVCYFETFAARAEFKSVSNKIRSYAEQKFRNHEFECTETPELLRRLSELSVVCMQDARLKSSTELEISECLVELDYIAGRSDRLSIRMKGLLNDGKL